MSKNITILGVGTRHFCFGNPWLISCHCGVFHGFVGNLRTPKASIGTEISRFIWDVTPKPPWRSIIADDILMCIIDVLRFWLYKIIYHYMYVSNIYLFMLSLLLLNMLFIVFSCFQWWSQWWRFLRGWDHQLALFLSTVPSLSLGPLRRLFWLRCVEYDEPQIGVHIWVTSCWLMQRMFGKYSLSNLKLLNKLCYHVLSIFDEELGNLRDEFFGSQNIQALCVCEWFWCV